MATPFHTRSDWGARPPRSRTALPSAEGVTCHYMGPSPWSGGRFDHTRCASIVRNIQRFHMDSRGWTDIAYNSLVCPHGHRYEGRGPGIRSAAQGTTAGNDRSEAVCYVGGDNDALTDAAKRAYHDEGKRMRSGRLRWGHRDWKSTGCPGDPIYRWRQAGFPHPGGTTTSPKEEGFLMALSDKQQDKLAQQVDRLAYALIPFYREQKPGDARFFAERILEKALPDLSPLEELAANLPAAPGTPAFELYMSKWLAEALRSDNPMLREALAFALKDQGYEPSAPKEPAG